MPSSRHRVLIVGGGFGGLSARQGPRPDDRVTVTLVDRRNHHLFTPLLYQVATGAVSPGEIAQPLRSILRRQRNTTVLLGEAVGPRRRSGARSVLADGGPLALRHADRRGRARASRYFGHDDWAGDRARPEVARRRARDPAPDPHRVRGRRARARPERRRRVADVRARRRRTDRRRAGRRARRDRPRHAPPRLPLDRHGGRRGSCSSRRSTGSCRPTRRIARESAAASSSGSGRRPDRRRGSSTSTIAPSRSRPPTGRRERDRRRGPCCGRRASSPSSFVAAWSRRPTGAPHRSLRPDRGRARPDRARPPGDLRRRRRGACSRGSRTGPCPASPRAAIQGGRYAARAIRRPPRRRARHAVPLLQPRRRRGHRAPGRRDRHPVARAVRAAERLRGLGRCGSGSTSST